MTKLFLIWLADESRVGIDRIPAGQSLVIDDEALRFAIGRLRVSVIA